MGSDLRFVLCPSLMSCLYTYETSLGVECLLFAELDSSSLDCSPDPETAFLSKTTLPSFSASDGSLLLDCFFIVGMFCNQQSWIFPTISPDMPLGTGLAPNRLLLFISSLLFGQIHILGFVFYWTSFLKPNFYISYPISGVRNREVGLYQPGNKGTY